MPEIVFPNLGIEINKLSRTAFTVLGLPIYWYGILITFAVVVGLRLAQTEAKKTGQDSEMYLDYLLSAFVFSIVGARLYYVVFSWDNYKDNLMDIFNIRSGGLAIYGGIIAGVVVSVVFARIKKINLSLFLDTIAPSIILGQAIGRWGNFFNREAFGGYTNSLFAMRYVKDQVQASNFTAEILENTIITNGIEYIQVHPTFLYESLWNLAVFFVLILYRRRKKFDGEIFALYVLLYGIGRAWIEGFRTDQLLLAYTNFPVSQVLSLLMAAASVVFIAASRKKNFVIDFSKEKKPKIITEQFFVGGKGAAGIKLIEVNYKEKSITEIYNLDIESASYLALSPDKKFLYCVNEVEEINDTPGGGITAFEIEEDGSLKYLNFAYSMGGSPRQLCVSDDGKFLFVSNYTGGSFSIYSLSKTGKINNLLQHIAHRGHGTNPARQESSHVKFTGLVPNTSKLAVCDLGIDKTYIYVFSEDFREILSVEETKMKSGSGPSYAVFSEKDEMVFVLNELEPTINSFVYNRETETFEYKGACKIDKATEDSQGTMLISQNEQTIMAAFGTDKIYKFENKDGNVSKKSEFLLQGDIPTDMAFGNYENYILNACEKSDKIVVLKRKGDKYISTGLEFETSMPSCIIKYRAL